MIRIILDGDGAFTDMAEREIIESNNISITALSRGMKSGRPSVAMRIDFRDNKTVFAQCSMREFLAAADAFRARYSEELKDNGLPGRFA